MVWRVPPPSDDAPPRRPTGLLAMFIVLVAVIGVWLVNGREPGTPTSAPPDSATSQSAPALDPASGLPLVALGDLPPEAAETVQLIETGGPFPESEDDGVFGNFEGLLPDRERGYYREYTVPTPGSEDRGARRIVGGSDDELYWTADHYASFERIVP